VLVVVLVVGLIVVLVVGLVDCCCVCFVQFVKNIFVEPKNK